MPWFFRVSLEINGYLFYQHYDNDKIYIRSFLGFDVGTVFIWKCTHRCVGIKYGYVETCCRPR